MQAWAPDKAEASRETMAAAIKQLVVEYETHPYDINCGMCEDFADDIEKLVPGAEVLWGEQLPDLLPVAIYDAEAHCFIRFEGFYFDAEEPYGVEHPTGLPLYMRQFHNSRSPQKHQPT